MKLNSLIPELYCSDYQTSLKFYIDILSFKIVYDVAEEGFAILDYQGSQLMIEEINSKKRTWLTGPMEQPYGRGINIRIDTDNVEELYNAAKDSGHDFFMELEEKWYQAGSIEHGCRQFLVQDPDGYLLRFAQDLGERPFRNAA